jgi:NAD(P)-dependent dehydrogenase (short-subunit alcohol dehydrogenase family)
LETFGAEDHGHPIRPAQPKVLYICGLHILVNSGSAPGGSATATGPIETVIDEDLLQDFNVKYVGALRCSRAVIPFMKMEGWGRIINISGKFRSRQRATAVPSSG